MRESISILETQVTLQTFEIRETADPSGTQGTQRT